MKAVFDDNHIREILIAAIDECGGVRAFSRKHGFFPSAVSSSARGLIGVSDTMAQVLGYRRVVAYVRQ